MQAPHLPKGIPLAHRATGYGLRATGYADVLLSQGWSDRSALWGLTQGGLNLFRMFQFATQGTAFLHVKGLIYRLVTYAHGWIVREIDWKPMSNLRWAPCSRPSSMLASTVPTILPGRHGTMDGAAAV